MKRRKESEKVKDDPKGPEEHDEQAHDSEIWSEEDFAWWTKGRKGKKGLSKGNDGFQKGGFRPYQPDKGAGKDYSQNKSKGKFQKRKRQG